MKDIEKLVEILKSKNLTLVTVESATCGMLASSIGDVSGVSSVFNGGFVVYTAQAKHEMLNINADLIETYGTVSEEIALAMLEKANEIINANCIISVTGNAGPTAIENKPVGLFYVGLKFNEYQTVRKVELGNNLSRNQARQFIVDLCIREMINLISFS